ncbi:uncharacterized protein LOC120339643 isoform X2 [Styela clava]
MATCKEESSARVERRFSNAYVLQPNVTSQIVPSAPTYETTKLNKSYGTNENVYQNRIWTTENPTPQDTVTTTTQDTLTREQIPPPLPPRQPQIQQETNDDITNEMNESRRRCVAIIVMLVTICSIGIAGLALCLYLGYYIVLWFLVPIIITAIISIVGIAISVFRCHCDITINRNA